MASFDYLLSRRTPTYSKIDVEARDNKIAGKLPHFFEEDDSGNKSKMNYAVSFSTEFHQVELEPLKNFRNLDALFLYTAPPFQMKELADIESQYSELIKPNPQIKRVASTSHNVVCHEASGPKISTDEVIRLGGERFIKSQYSELIKPNPQIKRVASTSHNVVCHEASGPKISTDEVIRLGGERFIQSRSSSVYDISSIASHPYRSSFLGLSDLEAMKDVHLTENLLLSAEKVTQQQYERSIKLLNWCDLFSWNLGNPIQRLVYYFSKALRDKIAGETGIISLNVTGKKLVVDIVGRMISPNPNAVFIYQKLPFYQAGQFCGVQALVDGVVGLKKVHIIDLSIKRGIQTTILMQALACHPNCPIDHLKITAIGTNFKEKIEQTGEWLKSFAESINLPFSFNAVIVEDMQDLSKDLLELDPEEALGVFSAHGLWNMLAQQDQLESLMKVIRSCNPRVMVVLESEANLNSPNFVNRFIEALFFYGALFDSLEDCMGREDENRATTESLYMGSGIRSIVAAEGAERVNRHVNIAVWRKYFSRFGMKEMQLSMSSLYQANLMSEKLPFGHSCTFKMDGNSLIIGWKGTPIQCLSAWQFSPLE